MSRKTAIITGGSKGIGYGIANSLMDEGYNVVISSRHEDEAKLAAKTLEQNRETKALAVVADVRKLEDQQKLVQSAIDEFGGVDVFVANAGVGHFAPIETLEPEDWHRVIDTNVTGVYYSIKASLEALKATKGYFITISSLAGTNFFPTASAYNASKFAVTGFSQAIMLDLRKYGVKVSTIMPGSVTSHFNGHTPSEEDAWKIQPQDIGELVIDLLRMHPRTLPSKIEVRPTIPPSAQ